MGGDRQGLAELVDCNVEDEGFWTRMAAAIKDIDIDRMWNDTALVRVANSFCGNTDISAQWQKMQQQVHHADEGIENATARASGGGPNCRVIVEAPPGVFFYPPSRIFCKAGDYIWDLVLIVPSLCAIDMTGQASDATNLWGMMMLRPFSKGSFGGIFFCFLTRTAYEPTMVVQGGPWRFDQCDIRSTSEIASVALVTLDRAEVTLSECAIGGLEPVVMKLKTKLDTGEEVQLFGEPNSGVLTYDYSWCKGLCVRVRVRVRVRARVRVRVRACARARACVRVSGVVEK